MHSASVFIYLCLCQSLVWCNFCSCRCKIGWMPEYFPFLFFPFLFLVLFFSFRFLKRKIIFYFFPFYIFFSYAASAVFVYLSRTLISFLFLCLRHSLHLSSFCWFLKFSSFFSSWPLLFVGFAHAYFVPGTILSCDVSRQRVIYVQRT